MISPALSIVIGVFNEDDGLEELYSRLTAALVSIGRTYEIILVDDGSRDRSLHVMEQLRARDPRHIKVLSFTRNFGHHIALTAGLDHATGDIVVMMDADLQDQPEELHKLLDKLDEGFDVVYGEREERKHSWQKKLTSRAFLWTMNKVVRSQVVLDSSIYRAMRRNVADDLRSMRERARYLPGMVRWTGYRQTSTPVTHGERFAGTTKYSVWKLLRLGLSTATSFSAAPLQFATVIGMITAGFALLFLVYIVVRKLLGEYHVLGYASLMFAVSFFGAMQLLVIGLMGEYVSRIYGESQARPLYLLKDLGTQPAAKMESAQPILLSSLSTDTLGSLERLLSNDPALPLTKVLHDVSSTEIAKFHLSQWARAGALLLSDRTSPLIYQPLDWDTEVLGIKAGRIQYAGGSGLHRDLALLATLKANVERLLQHARSEGMQLIDVKISNQNLFTMRAFEEVGFHMVDMLVTVGIERKKMATATSHSQFEYLSGNWKFSDSLRIRPMHEEEKSSLIRLSATAFSDHSAIQDRFYLEPSIPEERAARIFERWFENLTNVQSSGKGTVLVAELNGRAVGYLALEQMPAIAGKSIWKDSLNAVAEEARGQGVYKALVVAAIDHVHRQNGDVLITKTQSSTYRVLNTWLHLGCDIYENFATLHWVHS